MKISSKSDFFPNLLWTQKYRTRAQSKANRADLQLDPPHGPKQLGSALHDDHRADQDFRGTKPEGIEDSSTARLKSPSGGVAQALA